VVYKYLKEIEMKTFKIPSEDKLKAIKGYMDMGLSQSEIGRMLGISKQLVRYWVLKIKKGVNK
jgi:transposase-like protein